jgi:hypothetical protein
MRLEEISISQGAQRFSIALAHVGLPCVVAELRVGSLVECRTCSVLHPKSNEMSLLHQAQAQLRSLSSGAQKQGLLCQC